MTEKEELQYLFDKSYQHIMAQGRPSYYNGHCMYRSDNGLQCAAGPFIVEYDEGMEDCTFNDLIELFAAGRFDPIAVKHSNFITDELQDAHDSLWHLNEGEEFKNCFRAKMTKVALDYGLTVPTMDGN